MEHKVENDDQLFREMFNLPDTATEKALSKDLFKMLAAIAAIAGAALVASTLLT